jgi:hypothetical protein
MKKPSEYKAGDKITKAAPTKAEIAAAAAKIASDKKAAEEAAAKEASKAVAVVNSGATDLVTHDDFGDFAGMGTENVTAKDLLIPRLTILQDLSPQVKKNKPEFIEGAEIGQICDVGMGTVFEGPIIFLPVLFRKDYLEWAPRASGKGLIAIHDNDRILSKCTKDEKGRPFLPNGNYIAETAQFYGFNVTDGMRKCFIPMASTGLKKARQWMTLATGEVLRRTDGSSFMPPLFYRVYELDTVEDSNNEGTWFTWKITRGMSLPELPAELSGDSNWHALRDRCMEFHKSLVTGVDKADFEEPGEHDLRTGEVSGDQSGDDTESKM